MGPFSPPSIKPWLRKAEHAENDVGGFRIGSDCRAGNAASRCQITGNIHSEIGYRFLCDDYRDKNFLYQLSLHGTQQCEQPGITTKTLLNCVIALSNASIGARGDGFADQGDHQFV
jgi:hypothetical protein